jgi:D-alanyl-D-alanine carboxypeptidase
LRTLADCATLFAATGTSRQWSAVAVLAALVVCASSGGANGFGATAAPSGVAAKKPTKLQTIVRGLVKAGAPGALAFVRTTNRSRGAANGFANLQPRDGMRPNDRFRVASVTKTFVSTVVLQLVAEGRLGLDDPVERRLPGLVPNGGTITIRELLNHTSGLFDYTADQSFLQTLIANPGRVWMPRELLAVAFSHPPLFAPGANWGYSNTNYVLLGLVIEAVTSRPVGEELRERIFNRLSLRSTTFPAGTAVEGRFVHGYAVVPGTGGLPIDTATILSPTYSYAAGQIVSNAADVTTFFAALMKGRLLPAAQLKAMKTGSAASGVYGLGLRITQTRCGRAFGHDGDFPGYRNVVWAKADGRRVAVVMVNIDDTKVPWSRLQAAAETALCSG